LKINEDEKVLALTNHQRDVFCSKARFRVLVAGRRFGKTHLAMLEILKVAAQSNRVVWYVGPTEGQSKRLAWERLKRLTRHLWAKTPNETECRITLKSGSTIFVTGAHQPDSLRGDGLDFIVLDECAIMKPEAWSEVLRPALADRNGRALFIGTPKGRNHFYQRFEYAHAAPDWQAFQFTTEEGGVVPKSELEIVASELDPESYRQEFGAEFISTNSNLVYYPFSSSTHVKAVGFEPMYPLIWAIDFNINPLCMLLIQRVEETIQVFDEIILRNSNTDAASRAFVERAEPLSKSVPFVKTPLEVHIYGDSSGNQRRTSATDTDWMIIRNRMSHWKGTFNPIFHNNAANPYVRDRVNCVNSRLQTQDDQVFVKISPRCRELIKDLEQVSWAVNPTGSSLSEIDKSDPNRTHTSDALGYYIAQAFSMKPKVGFKNEILR
jgi:hypothetical protein